MAEREGSVRVSDAQDSGRGWRMTKSRISIRVLDSHLQKCSAHIPREERNRLLAGRGRLLRRLQRMQNSGGGEEKAMFSWQRFLEEEGLTGVAEVA
jgi:hypothetical protein